MKRFLRIRDVVATTGLCKSAIYAFVKDGQFPPPIEISTQARAWDSDEIGAWMAEKKAHRDMTAAA